VTFAMDIMPHQVIRRLHMGLLDEVLPNVPTTSISPMSWIPCVRCPGAKA
jgi:hypothetical protein